VASARQGNFRIHDSVLQVAAQKQKHFQSFSVRSKNDACKIRPLLLGCLCIGGIKKSGRRREGRKTERLKTKDKRLETEDFRTKDFRPLDGERKFFERISVFNERIPSRKKIFIAPVTSFVPRASYSQMARLCFFLKTKP
jgi:hypothetical protein